MWPLGRLTHARNACYEDGKDVGVFTYEVSADGKTLTSRYSTSPQQVLVFDRQEYAERSSTAFELVSRPR